MKLSVIISFIVSLTICSSSCNTSPAVSREKDSYPSSADTALAAFINGIKAVDNHAHPNSIDPDDKGSDALPLDGLGNIELPARVGPKVQIWLDAAKAVYGFSAAAA